MERFRKIALIIWNLDLVVTMNQLIRTLRSRPFVNGDARLWYGWVTTKNNQVHANKRTDRILEPGSFYKRWTFNRANLHHKINKDQWLEWKRILVTNMDSWRDVMSDHDLTVMPRPLKEAQPSLGTSDPKIEYLSDPIRNWSSIPNMYYAKVVYWVSIQTHTRQ